MQTWDNVESNRHWSKSALTLNFLGFPAIAWLWAPAVLGVQLAVLVIRVLLSVGDAYLWPVVMASLVWHAFWTVMSRKGLTLTSLKLMIRRRFQGNHLAAAPRRLGEF